jgi:hypothetical protein
LSLVTLFKTCTSSLKALMQKKIKNRKAKINHFLLVKWRYHIPSLFLAQT